MFTNPFAGNKPIFGVIHVDALPGTPQYSGNIYSIIEKAKYEADVYLDAGISGIIVENMHDVPYLRGSVGPEITSLMSIIGYEVKNKTNLPCGIQILAGANKEALASAHSAGLDFIRAEGFVFAHVADEGIFESCAGELLRFRKQIGAEKVMILTDIKKKHSSHSITSDVDIVDTAKAAEFFLSDGVVVTGKATGEEADINEIEKVKNNVAIPVLVGSGVTDKNVKEYLAASDGLIVGTYFKQDGRWVNMVDMQRVKNLLSRCI